MDQLLAMMNSMGSMLGGRDMLTGERWQPPPLTAAQRQLDRAMTSGGVDAMQAVLAANPGMDVNFHTEQGGFTLLHMAALNNQAQVAALLLDAGAEVDVRAPTTRETPLVAAACYGHVEVIRLLLERGANPHLSDWSGDTAMSRLKARLDGGPRFGEVLRLVQAAAAATSPLSRAARREAGCGGCGAQGVKLSVCARCGLRSYCTRDCQVRDFPQHKQRCKAVGEFKQHLALLVDVNAALEARRGIIKRLERDQAACQMARDLKGVKLLLEALPSERPQTLSCFGGPVPQETRLLSLCALWSVVTEREGSMPLPPYAKVLYAARDAMQQFAAARGMEVVLERILAADCPADERIQGIRLVSCLCQATQEQQLVPRSVVRKGQAEAVVKLLARLIKDYKDVNAIFANSCVCLACLAIQEGQSFEELSRQASSSSSASTSTSSSGTGSSSASGSGSRGSGADGKQDDMWPVTAAIFEHVDLSIVGRRLYSANRGLTTAAVELLAVLSRSRPAFERLMADELICRNLTGAFYAALFMAAPEASGLALEWWEVAHRHRPGLLLDRWYVWMREEVQRVLEEVCGREAAEAAFEGVFFVRTVLDPIDAEQPVERGQQGSFVSSRHALKAARLLAHVMAAPQLPRSLLLHLLEMIPDMVAGVQKCKDPEAAAVLQQALVAFGPRAKAELGASMQPPKKKTGRRR